MLGNKAEYTLHNNLVCPFCHNQLIKEKGNFRCSECDNIYPIIDDIPNFNQKDEYWCNVDREKMYILNQKAKDGGDWLAAAKEIIPEYLGHIEPFDRADAQYLWPITNDSRILDAGSMWGGVTLPVAQHCGEIYALDKTIETLSFLKTRAQQMGFENVHVVASPLQNLPFPDDFFDLVILNGVLEWVAFDQPVILEEHWGKKRTDDVPLHLKNPRQMQVEVLNEIRRILKPDGHLHLAIENRIGYPYFIGYPDDHMNLKYIPFLPRFFANIITKWKLNCEYRTYLYSMHGYRSLLKDAGFKNVEFYGAFPHYGQPSYIIPVDCIKHWKKSILPIYSPNISKYIKIVAKAFPKNLLKHVSPSFIILANKSEMSDSLEPRIIQLLIEAKIIHNSNDFKAAKFGGRPGNYHTANFIIYSKNGQTPLYFCKVCRDGKYKDILKDEANNISTISELLGNTEIKPNITKLLYFGTIDGMTLLVTQFIKGNMPDVDVNDIVSKSNMKKFDNVIRLAIEFLVKYQQKTQVRNVEAGPYLLSLVKKQKGILEEKGRLTKDVDMKIDELIDEIKKIEDLSIPTCAVHGDYDLCNIFISGKDINVFDFEHFEIEGLPFFDIANILFNPILITYQNLKIDIPFEKFIDRYKIRNYLIEWLNLYSRLSGISPRLLNILAPLAAIEQQTKLYPYYRDPTTYPMYVLENFYALLSLRVYE